MGNVSNEVMQQVREARAAEWAQMAERRPDHHILSIELSRISDHNTAAVIVAVRHHKVVQYILVGDARGGNVRPVLRTHCEASQDLHAVLRATGADVPTPPTPMAMAMMYTSATPPVDTDTIGLGGGPPPIYDPPPAMVSLGGSMLGISYGVADGAG
jgi:hypothetical protein